MIVSLTVATYDVSLSNFRHPLLIRSSHRTPKLKQAVSFPGTRSSIFSALVDALLAVCSAPSRNRMTPG